VQAPALEPARMRWCALVAWPVRHGAQAYNGPSPRSVVWEPPSPCGARKPAAASGRPSPLSASPLPHNGP